MIELGEIWSDIRNDELVRKTKFDPNFLSLIAEIVKKNGYHEAKLYLWDFHASREDLREQALALVSV
ncbi:MAG TPA: hypothetical protein ENG50_04295, partial [Candidatus Altiarchaeales archaeon]|nr:hypothetical protein [Candidatus Altiarchaeales archaeon]